MDSLSVDSDIEEETHQAVDDSSLDVCSYCLLNTQLSLLLIKDSLTGTSKYSKKEASDQVLPTYLQETLELVY